MRNVQTVLAASTSAKNTILIASLLWGVALMPLSAQGLTPKVEESRAAEQEKGDKSNAQQVLVHEAAELAANRHTQQAFAKVEEALEGYKSRFADEDRRLYSIRTSTEGLLYMAMAASDKRDAVAVDFEYGFAWYLRGYMLIEQQRLDEALPALEKAIELSPMNSQYLAEAAHIHEERSAWNDALALYEKADGASEFSGDAAQGHKARALRGKGFVLARMGRLDEAETAYRGALLINPSDTRATDGLNTIRNLREDG